MHAAKARRYLRGDQGDTQFAVPNIAFYLFTEQYPGEFRIQEYNAWPHPDDWAKENKTSTLSLLDNPTGMSVVEGEELIVFADETNGYPLSLKIQDLDTPGRDGYNNASFYPLSPGVNKIIPRNKGLIYLFYHTPDYRNAPPVTVHFATGTVNGYYDSQKHDRSDWARLLGGATNKHFDVLGKYAHLTFETAAFISYASNDGPPLIDAYDDLVHLEQDFMGIMKYDRSRLIALIFMSCIPPTCMLPRIEPRMNPEHSKASYPCRILNPSPGALLTKWDIPFRPGPDFVGWG